MLLIRYVTLCYHYLHCSFTLTFEAEANIPFEPKTLLRLSSVTWYSISINQCGLNQETSSCLSHARAVCFRVPANKMSRQPTVAKFNFTITIEHRGSQRNENNEQKKEVDTDSQSGYVLSMFLKLWVILASTF